MRGNEWEVYRQGKATLILPSSSSRVLGTLADTPGDYSRCVTVRPGIGKTIMSKGGYHGYKKIREPRINRQRASD
jgi:hypothetical protein